MWAQGGQCGCGRVGREEGVVSEVWVMEQKADYVYPGMLWNRLQILFRDMKRHSRVLVESNII